MRYLFLILFTLTLLPLTAQNKAALPEGETNWPGVRYQILYVHRILQNHLLVGIRIYATSKAPAGGTRIAKRNPITPDTAPQDIVDGTYVPSQFTMDSSVMTDELTQKTYPVVPSIAPPGKIYCPAVLLETLAPGQSDVVVIQFETPPLPPPPPPGQPPIKQTLSFLFTNAKGPITNVPLPPPSPSSTGP